MLTVAGSASMFCCCFSATTEVVGAALSRRRIIKLDCGTDDGERAFFNVGWGLIRRDKRLIEDEGKRNVNQNQKNGN